MTWIKEKQSNLFNQKHSFLVHVFFVYFRKKIFYFITKLFFKQKLIIIVKISFNKKKSWIGLCVCVGVGICICVYKFKNTKSKKIIYKK
jgi:hypothetical protein